MYAEISVKGLRCFADFRLSDLVPVNLIVGPNNVGKTTLLEAVFLCSGRTNPELVLRLQKYRGMQVAFSTAGQAPWDMLFHNLDRSHAIEIGGIDTEGNSSLIRVTALENGAPTDEVGEQTSSGVRGLSLKLELKDGKEWSEYRLVLRKDGVQVDEIPPPPFQCIFMFARGRGGGGADDVERFSDLSINRRSKPVVDAMRIIEPRLGGLTVNMYVGSAMIYADIGLPQWLPVQVLGDGAGRVVSMMTSIATCRNGVVLIDEIDAGLHHSNHVAVWRAIMQLALDLNVQVFATTHSHECLVAARIAAREFTADIFRTHRLDRVGEKIEAVTYDREALDGAIAADLEVR